MPGLGIHRHSHPIWVKLSCGVLCRIRGILSLAGGVVGLAMGHSSRLGIARLVCLSGRLVKIRSLPVMFGCLAVMCCLGRHVTSPLEWTG